MIIGYFFNKILVNCSGGPESLIEPIKKMYSVSSVPLSVKANAGMPELVDGKVVFKQDPEQFSSYTRNFIDNGVRLIGGCCGTTPELISAIKKELGEIKVPYLDLKFSSTIASAFNFIILSVNQEYSIQKLSLKEPDLVNALKKGDFDEIIEFVRDYESESVDYLLVDFGDIGECFDIWGFVISFSMSIKRPIIIKSESTEVLYKFLRYYPGKAGWFYRITLKYLFHN
jgi:hypothetical protein